MRDWAIRLGDQKQRWAAASLWVAALAVRCLYIFQSDASPFFDFPLVDAKTYTDTAARMAAQGEWGGGDEPFWQPPFYPYFLGLIYALAEPGYYLPRFVQAVVGAFNCLLIYILGRRVFSPAIGLAAGVAAALYGPFIFFDAEFLPPTLAVCFNLLLLLALPWALRGGYGRMLLTGVLFGIAALCVANILLFLPCAAAWVYWQKRDLHGRQRLLAVLPLLLGVALAIAPVTARNYLRGDWVLISSNAGINFYIGNNADYDKTVRIQPGPAWRALVMRPRLEAGTTQPSQQSSFFFSQAWEFMRAQPGAYLALLLHKSYLLGHGNEIGRNQDLYFARQHSPLLAALLWKWGVAFPFGALAPLAVIGIGLACWRGRWRQSDPALLLLFLGTYALSIVLFFVTARYRLPLIPGLLLFAAFAVREVWALWREGRRSLVAGLGVAVVALLVTSNRGLEAMNMAGDADTQHRLGFVFQQKGLVVNAIDAYQLALALDPDIEEARFNLGSLYARRREYRRAEAEYRAFIARYPEHAEASYALANVLLDTRRYGQAAELYEQLLERPSSVEQSDIGIRLAYARLQLNQPKKAEATYRRLLQSQPQLSQVRFMLGQFYESQMNNTEARRQYEEIVRRDPGHAEARYRLAYVLFQQERPAEAKAHLQQLIAQQPRSVEARWLLAKQYVVEHDGDEALRQVEKILEIQPSHVQANRMAGHLHVIRGDTLTGAQQLDLFKKLHVEERSKEIQEQLLDKWRRELGGALNAQ